MGARTLLVVCCIFIAGIAAVKAQTNMDSFCRRFPTNSNCVRPSSSSSSSQSSRLSSSSSSSSSSSRNSQPVNPSAVGLPPPPSSQGGSSQTAPSPKNDPCVAWRPVYEKYCISGNVQAEYQSSCTQYQQSCLGGGGAGNGLGSGGPQPQPQPSQGAGGGPQPQPQPQGSGIGATWNALTQKAQADQAQQALIDAQNGQANCGQYQQNYNVWCGGAQQVNAVYCNTLGRVCAQQAQQAAAGQSTFGGPFAGNGGLPTGGAGSTRPLTVGQNFGVGPFFGMDKTLGVNPLQGVGQRQGFNVPIAGIGVQSSKGVDWGGLPGVAQLGAALGGRRRRWAIPVGTDHFGNVVYFIH